MRFKNQRSASVPIIDLTPMLNVMMATLAFFVLISMTLTIEQGVNVKLPTRDDNNPNQNVAAPLIVELTEQQQIILNNQQLTKQQLITQVQIYLKQNPQGSVLLKPNSELPYEQVVQLLGEMRDIGGERTSLIID